jgi:hypothetical protein
MLNEQLTRMTPFSHIDQPGLSWRTRERREEKMNLQKQEVEMFFSVTPAGSSEAGVRKNFASHRAHRERRENK